MPSWVSKDGKCYPAQEHVALKDKDGKDFIYEGPDRAAKEELLIIDPSGETDHIGMDFRTDPDLIARSKQFNEKSVEDYAKNRGYKPEKAEKDFEEKASEIKTHSLPDKKSGIQEAGGGINTAGEGHLYGGFGEKPKV